jgi:hypothetical protein
LSRRTIHLAGVAAAAFCLVVSSIRCNYSKPESYEQTDSLPKLSSLPGPERSPSVKAEAGDIGRRRDDETRKALLESAMTLIKRAALEPGGDNFRLAIQKLNQYFEGTSRSDYELDSAAREYLKTQLPPAVVESFSNRTWSDHDTRHIEDCMMYYPIAKRVAGTGENLARVRRVFQWVVEQIQLVPPGSLGFEGLPQAYARPYDVLVRGMATEAQGVWAERAWLFIALCRQLEIDAGLITYSHSRSLEPRFPRYGLQFEMEPGLRGMRFGPKPPVAWICAAIIDKKAYLFDARLGLEIPGPDGTGVATLDDALADAAVLERMNLPGHSPYGTSRASLLGSTTKIGILFDSSPGYFSPKMKLLQQELAGEHRTILFRDPADEREQFAQAIGERCGEIKLWNLPIEVYSLLFSDGQFVKSIQKSMYLFTREYPLIYARVKQLRGELDEATKEYVALRFTDNAPQVKDKNKTISADIQEGLDAYATYFMALAQLEKARLANKPPERAAQLFRDVLDLVPEPGITFYFPMLRWGANANLGRIFDASKDNARAIAYYAQADPTTQGHGNLLRVREMIWRDPIAGATVVLPAAPAASPIPAGPATPPRNLGLRGGN